MLEEQTRETRDQSLTTFVPCELKPELTYLSLTRFLAKVKDRLLQLASTPSDRTLIQECHNGLISAIGSPSPDLERSLQ